MFYSCSVAKISITVGSGDNANTYFFFASATELEQKFQSSALSVSPPVLHHFQFQNLTSFLYVIISASHFLGLLES
ncbi:uncharacterized protein Bfra_012354 [Botrytis fragariae]|uniref:Uncharacterized protein n=1 Tax=Botrytis fragariae TaxID=1964551 RepID=A0A8H6AJE2_9HELO|nr:uncharacterized protein Bfra_012354 [Botrytis fragariae]KAF5868444.1 hypothetical protein Bfra_012354 [Botrytis fragariae]